MIKLGEMQTLVVAKEVDFGVYLRENEDDDNKEDDVLLPIKQVPDGTKKGDKIEVFIYRDSNDRMIATVRRPKLVIGEIGYLKVAEISKIGAFLNWGLEKDLFLPYKEQIGELRVNGEYIVGIYIDKSNRLCATMNLYNVLRTDSPYKLNDKVKGTVFSLRRGLGAMVAVDGKYLGMIHEKELFRPIPIGEEVEVRINQVKEDGKLSLSLKDAPRMQIDKDGEQIYNKLIKNNGQLPFNDDSSSMEIQKTLNMSKSSFKKAIGNLMKRKLIVITKSGIELVNESNVEVRDSRNSKDYRDKKDYGDKKSFGDKKDYGDKKSFGDKKNYGDKKSFGDKKDYGDKKSFGDKKDYGDKKSFGDKKDYGDKKSFGDKKDYGDKKSFGDKKDYGDKKSFGGKKDYGDKKSFGDKKDYGDKKSFGDKKDYGDKKSFGDKKDYGDKKSFGDKKDYGDKKSFGDKKDYGDKKSFGDKKDYGDKKNYGDKKSFGDKKDYGDKKSFGDKKDYGDKKSFGDKKDFKSTTNLLKNNKKPQN